MLKDPRQKAVHQLPLYLPLHVWRKWKKEEEQEKEVNPRKMREGEWEWKETGRCLWKNKDTEGAGRGGAWRVFIYTTGFMACCLCSVAWEPSPPGWRKQHHFKLEWPLCRWVSCQKVHGRRIPRKSPDLSPTTAAFMESQHRKASLWLQWRLCLPLTLNATANMAAPSRFTLKRLLLHKWVFQKQKTPNWRNFIISLWC